MLGLGADLHKLHSSEDSSKTISDYMTSWNITLRHPGLISGRQVATSTFRRTGKTFEADTPCLSSLGYFYEFLGQTDNIVGFCLNKPCNILMPPTNSDAFYTCLLRGANIT